MQPSVIDSSQITENVVVTMTEQEQLKILRNPKHPDSDELNQYRKDIIMSMFLFHESNFYHASTTNYLRNQKCQRLWQQPEF